MSEVRADMRKPSQARVTQSSIATRSGRWIALLFAGASGACSADPGHAEVPVATVVAPEPTSTAVATAPETTATPTTTAVIPEVPPAATSPAVSYADIVDSPGDPALVAGADALKKGDAAEARKLLTAAIPTIDKSGTPDVQMAARALVARACQSLKDAKCADEMHAAVIERYKDPVAVQKALEGAVADDTERVRRLARALNAVGESLYFQAELKRLAAAKMKMPQISGKASKEAMMKHLQTKVATWVKDRQAAIDEAEKGYLRIVSLTPVPPPRWVVDASSRVGAMWSAFVAEFRSAPVPAEWKQTGPVAGSPDVTWEDVRAAYHAALDDASAPQLAKARAAFLQCQSMSKKYSYTDALTQECDDWINKHPSPPSP